METEPSNPNSNTLPTGLLAVWGRPLAVATAIVFLVSSAFPVAAGLSKNTAAFPKWWGALDVGIAFVLGSLAVVVMTLAQGHVSKNAHDSSYRVYRIVTHGIFGLIVVFFLFGDRITWIYCLTGFAWRGWLFLYVLPTWFTAFGAPAARG